MSRRTLALFQRSLTAFHSQPVTTLLSSASKCPASLLAATECNWVRSISLSSAPQISVTLAAVLAQEIKHEAKEYVKPDIVASGPPAPFVLQEIPGDTLLTLTRDFEGEEVSIALQVTDQPEPEDFVGSEADGALAINSVAFNVSVRRGDQQLVFECESDGGELVIAHVSHEPAGKPAGDTHFSGPVFEELDEAVVREFTSYLTARGIDAELGEYLRHLVHDKEQREYADWLKRVHDFVARK